MRKQLTAVLLRRSWIASLVGWCGICDFVRNGPSKRAVALAYQLTHRNRWQRSKLLSEVLAHPESRAIVESRQWLRSYEEFADYAEGTLGQEYCRFMHKNKLTYPVPIKSCFKSDFQYIIYRILNTHDLYHVVLGMPTDVYGEAAVATFTSTQLPSYTPPAVHVASGILFLATKRLGVMERANFYYVLGYLFAQQAKLLFAVNWDAWWNVPLDEVRRELGIDVERTKALIGSINNRTEATIGSSSPVHYSLFELKNRDLCVIEKYIAPAGDAAQKVVIYMPPTNDPKVVCILGRALFSRGSYFARERSPSMVSCLVQHGLHVLLPKYDDTSVLPRTFDELVKRYQACIALTNRLYPGARIILIGHSLSGLGFLCAQGLAAEPNVRGIITIGTGVWHRGLIAKEALRVRWPLQAAVHFIRLVGRLSDPFPARKLRFGDADEYMSLIDQVTLQNYRDRPWRSLDDQVDYYEAISAVDCAVRCIASYHDRLMPVSLVRALHARLGAPVSYSLHNDFGHMGLASSPWAWAIWQDMAEWALARCAPMPIENERSALALPQQLESCAPLSA